MFQTLLTEKVFFYFGLIFCEYFRLNVIHTKKFALQNDNLDASVEKIALFLLKTLELLNQSSDLGEPFL
jgi:hypothetical protein